MEGENDEWMETIITRRFESRVILGGESCFITGAAFAIAGGFTAR
jgi:hypothetical protein